MASKQAHSVFGCKFEAGLYAEPAVRKSFPHLHSMLIVPSEYRIKLYFLILTECKVRFLNKVP